jgi:vancomycin permeability regulator SanA
MIFSGGPTENQFVEGEVMAKLAEEQGVPPSAIVVEGEAQNTIQNIYFSDQIMQRRGWTSVEVVSSPSHLPRAGLILEHYHFQWKEHASQWPPEYGWRQLALVYASEVTETCVRRWRGFSPSPFLPPRYAS